MLELPVWVGARGNNKLMRVSSSLSDGGGATCGQQQWLHNSNWRAAGWLAGQEVGIGLIWLFKCSM